MRTIQRRYYLFVIFPYYQHEQETGGHTTFKNGMKTHFKGVVKMLYILLLTIIVTLFVLFKAYKDRKQFESISSMIMDLVHVNDNMHTTLLLGIYHRFQKENGVEFQRFVGNILEDFYGGKVSITSEDDEYGIDLVQQRNNGTYFGKVICISPEESMNMDPIVFVHSNMVKFGADYGFVLSTGQFTTNARKYAEGLNIELIEGDQLVRLWVESLEKQKEYIPGVAY